MEFDIQVICKFMAQVYSIGMVLHFIIGKDHKSNLDRSFLGGLVILALALAALGCIIYIGYLGWFREELTINDCKFIIGVYLLEILS